MSLHFIDDKFVIVREDASSFFPNAAEIYNVVFEEAVSIRGYPVLKKDFIDLDIVFSDFVADPLIVLLVQQVGGAPRIFCEFIAKSGSFESKVAQDGATMLGYAISERTWMPLPDGSTEDAQELLRSLGLKSFGLITLFQYLQILRCSGRTFAIEDKTSNALSAANVSTLLKGTLPSGFKGQLYHYQNDGFNWLSFMIHNGLGAIVADEMGLGKTVQIICLLLQVVEQNKTPNLVVAPATLLENWRRELHRFAPSLRVIVHAGARRTGFPNELLQHDVVVCSFDTAVADISLFRNLRWHLLVIDEAQAIKNPQAKRSAILKTLPRDSAIAVTGTPVENRLIDLWSITDLVLPSYLGNLADFERDHKDDISSASMLEPIVSPLILRRRVAEVAKDLPERIDIPQPLELDTASIEAYEAIRGDAQTQGTSGSALAILTKLRMFCTHPWISGYFRNSVSATDCSSKLSRLFEILEEIVDSNGKAIIFTSYSESIDLLVTETANRLGIHTDFIDGRIPVSDRQAKVDTFSAHKSSAVLVLNPKAAGTGLNITAANHVIHFNLEWNPAVEDQASARAYRRGQTQTVTVHKLFYANTVEEIINERMQKKREVAEAAIVGTVGDRPDVQDVLRALRISPSANK